MRRVVCSVAVVVLVVLATCTNPMLETVEQVVQAHSTASFELGFPNGDGIAPTSAITIVFSESMDPSTMIPGGDMVGESDGGVWSTTSQPNDTLTFTPTVAWSAGGHRTLSVAVDDLQTYPCEPLDLTHWVLDGVVYVHAGNGRDGNPGTSDLPKASIRAAIATAEAAYDEAEVRVAGGTYDVVSTTHVSSSITITGGYSAADWTIRDPDAYPALVRDLRGSGTNETFSIRPGVAAVIDGLSVFAPNGRMNQDGTAAVFVSGSHLEIRNSRIVTGTAQRAYGVVARDATLLVDSTTVDAKAFDGRAILVAADNSTVTIAGSSLTGNFVAGFYGISLEECDSLIERSLVDAASPTSEARAITVLGGSATIRNNVISAGDMVSGDVIGQYGIFLSRTDVIVQNNTIDGGTGSSAANDIMTTGVMLFSNVASVFQNNIVFTSGGDIQTGVWQRDAASLPTVFESNCMYECSGGNYYHEPTNTGWTENLDGENGLEPFLSGAGVTVSGNTFDNASLGPGFRLTAASPPSVAEGGKALFADFDVDREGTPRTEPWSMGAYEYD